MSQFLARLRTATNEGDEGIGLAELVVTMFLGTLVLVILGTTFAATRGTVSGVSARTQNTQQQRSAMNALTKSIRTAIVPKRVVVVGANFSAATTAITTPFCRANANELFFYGNTNPGSLPVLLRYSVDASGNLLEQAKPAPNTSDVAPCTTTTFTTKRIIASNVQTSTDIFSYVKQDGSVLPMTAGALPSTSFASVDSVRISLDIATPTNPAVPATTVQTQVMLPNVSNGS